MTVTPGASPCLPQAKGCAGVGAAQARWVVMSVVLFIQTCGRKHGVSRIVGRRDHPFHATPRWPGNGADSTASGPFVRPPTPGG